MKKIILIAPLIVLALCANAQISFGGHVGANFASAKFTDNTGIPSSSQTFKTKVGLTLGAVAEIELGNGLSFRPELNYIQKGGKLKISETESVTGFTSAITVVGKLSLNYLQLAPNFVYNFKAGRGKVFVGIGPDVSFGIGGKFKSSFTSTTIIEFPGSPATTYTETENFDIKVKFDGKKNADLASTDNYFHLKSLDFGINVLAGYKLSNGAFISAGYTIGLSNINPNEKQSLKNSGFNIKLGFIFGGRNNKD
jgi:Outer membrane protein beta-barrel domain